MITTYDFPAKARWREWMAKQIKQTKLRVAPAFRRTLVLDPQLLEVQMLEGLGYKPRNILVVERDPKVFAELQERNEDRKRQGKEQVVLENADLEDLFVDIILGKKKHGSFEHVSLDMLCPMNPSYLALIHYLSSARLLAPTSIFVSNLQAKREDEALTAYDVTWNFSRSSVAEIREKICSIQDPVTSLNAAFKEILSADSELERRREQGESLADLRVNARPHIECNHFRISTGVLHSGALFRLFGKYLVKHIPDLNSSNFLGLLNMALDNKSTLNNFLYICGKLTDTIEYMVNIEASTFSAEEVRAVHVFDSPFSGLFYPLKLCTDGVYVPSKVNLYKYQGLSYTPMLTAFYVFNLVREEIDKKDLSDSLRVFLTALARCTCSKDFDLPFSIYRPSVSKRFEKVIRKYPGGRNLILTSAILDPNLEIDQIKDDFELAPEKPISEAIYSVEPVIEQTPESAPSKTTLTTKEQVYAAFSENSDWSVKDLQEHFDTSAFTAGQLGAYRAWVTIRSTERINGNGYDKSKLESLDPKILDKILEAIRAGLDNEQIQEQLGVSAGQVGAVRAHETMKRYEDEASVEISGVKFFGTNERELAAKVRVLVLQYKYPEDIPPEKLIERGIRRENS